MGGYSKQASAGLIALIALRRARAEYDRRKAEAAARTADGGAGPETVPAPKKKKRGWFG